MNSLYGTSARVTAGADDGDDYAPTLGLGPEARPLFQLIHLTQRTLSTGVLMVKLDCNARHSYSKEDSLSRKAPDSYLLVVVVGSTSAV